MYIYVVLKSSGRKLLELFLQYHAIQQEQICMNPVMNYILAYLLLILSKINENKHLDVYLLHSTLW